MSSAAPTGAPTAVCPDGRVPDRYALKLEAPNCAHEAVRTTLAVLTILMALAAMYLQAGAGIRTYRGHVRRKTILIVFASGVLLPLSTLAHYVALLSVGELSIASIITATFGWNMTDTHYTHLCLTVLWPLCDVVKYDYKKARRFIVVDRVFVMLAATVAALGMIVFIDDLDAYTIFFVAFLASAAISSVYMCVALIHVYNACARAAKLLHDAESSLKSSGSETTPFHFLLFRLKFLISSAFTSLTVIIILLVIFLMEVFGEFSSVIWIVHLCVLMLPLSLCFISPIAVLNQRKGWLWDLYVKVEKPVLEPAESTMNVSYASRQEPAGSLTVTGDTSKNEL